MSTSHPPPHAPSPSSSPPPSLPPPRDFMTSLFNSLTSPNSSSPTQTSNPNPNPNPNLNSAAIANPQRFSKENERDNGNQNRTQTQTQKQNPLKQLDAQKKALLMTLHVIFPPPLLLHTLDLLDRGGVTRVVLREEGDIGGRAGTGEEEEEDLEKTKNGERKGMEKKSSEAGEKEQESRRDMEVEDTEVGELGIDARKHKLSPHHPSPSHPSPNPHPPKSKPKPLYQVRSSQPSKWHSSRSASASGAGPAHAAAENTYIVHLDAWNCSCAAFTFSAFPASTSASSPYFPWSPELPPEEEHLIPEQREQEKEETWRYGGWTKTSQVPICKHLLACLLVERWGDVLGTYVRERVVGREEMGGLVV
ncbi:hypothetical protein BOTCAL_0289g00120 [Botryotinia calthae]|uniref:SWIM-type domain-containing protein n=1 Tax=Botryotinia calthae TaxID=38488 RepID=A0A4Y8CX80_9HELO|nr:hypothetical protein BOTCAL_0289g00120 [Botryotinia calthae]